MTARSALRIELGLFALVLAVCLLALRVDFGYDGQMMYRVTESLALRHSFQIQDPVWHANEPYAYFGLGVSLLLLPFYALGSLLTGDGSRLIVIYGPLLTAITAWVLLRLLRELGASLSAAVAIALAFAFSTLAWHYSTSIFSEPLVGLGLTLAVLWLRAYGRDPRRRWLVAAGAAAGLTLLARWDSLLLVVAPIAIYAAFQVLRSVPQWPGRLRAFAGFSSPIAAALAVNLWYDWLRYGNVFTVGTGKALEGGFSTPLWTGLYGLLLSPGAGLLVYVPLLIFSAALFPRFYRRARPEALLLLSLLLLRLLFYARWSFWDGRDWGPRFLVPLLPLLLLPLVVLPARRWIRAAALALAGAGLAIEVLGQVVPYDTIVWPQTAPLVVRTLQLHDPSGSTCLCSWVVDQAASAAMDFQPRFAPLVRQVVLLGEGVVDPSWSGGAPVRATLVAVAAMLALALFRAARRTAPAPGARERVTGSLHALVGRWFKGRRGSLPRGVAPLPVAAALVAAALMLGFNLLDELAFLGHSAKGTDFFLYLTAARIGNGSGWSHIYDPQVFLPALGAAGVRLQPYLNPPPLAWLVLPLTALPYPLALTVWSAALAVVAFFTWRLTAPGAGLTRVAYGMAAAALYVDFMGFRLGNVSLLVAGALAACVWLLRQRRPLMAGLLLGAALILKPQAAILVPVALLVAGYWRATLGSLLVAVPAAVASAVVLGVNGLEQFLVSANLAHSMVGAHQLTLLAAIGSPGLALAAMALCALLALAVAFRARRRGVELPVAAGIAGSLLATPYISGADLSLLVLGAWLVLSTGPPRWQRLLMMGGAIEIAFFVGTVPLTVTLEVVWLLSLLALAARPRTMWIPRAQLSGRARRVVVLPAYRAEKTLRDVLAQIPQGEVDRILLVDDASADRTAELAVELGIDVIKHPRNLGYGGNQKTCYANALLMGAEVVVMLHPDGQYDPGLVPALCRAVEEGRGDLVMGSRWLGLDPAAAGMPGWKRAGNRFLTWVENQVLGLGLSEYHTGYRAYSRRFLETVPFAENSNDFVFDTQVLIQASAFGFRVAEIPAVGRYFEDASSIGFRTSAVYGLKTLGALVAFLANRGGVPCRWLRARRPLVFTGEERLAA